MAGHAVIGGVSNVPGMPAQAAGTAKIAHTGLNLLAVGQLAKTAMNLIPEGSEVTVKVRKGSAPKKSGGAVVDKMLGW